MITVGLLWHSLSSGNLGVCALTESNIAIIRSSAEAQGLTVKFILLGNHSLADHTLAAELAEAGHAIEVSAAGVFRSRYRSKIRECDLVIDIGEGDSFSDIYGFKRFFYYWLSKNIVCNLDKPLILAPQTIGPFNNGLTRILAKQVMIRCTSVFARDVLSSAYLSTLDITLNTHESIDVAFRLPFQRQSFGDNGKVRVGINISALLLNGGYTRNNQFSLKMDYGATMRQILTYFSSDPNVELHLIPHVIVPNMPIEDDVAAVRKLAQEYPNAVVAPSFGRPSTAKSYISGLDYFIGARMHACIAAFSAGIAVLPLAYSRKFNGLFASLGYRWYADCTKQSTEEVVQLAIRGYLERNSLASEVRSSLTKVNGKLLSYESNLALHFSSFPKQSPR